MATVNQQKSRPMPRVVKTPAKKPVPEYVAGHEMPKVKKSILKRIPFKLIIWLVLPAVLAGYYWANLATDRYLTVASVIVKDSGNLSGAADSISLIGAIPPTMRDVMLVKDYIESWDMLDYLDKELSLRQHYQQSYIDWVSRLKPDTSREDFLKYYQGFLELEYNELSSSLSIRVQAFDKETSHEIVERILLKSEDFINDIGHKLAQEQMLFVDGELARSRESLSKAKAELIQFQEENNTFSPEQQSNAMMSLIGTLEVDLAKAEADLKESGSYLNDNAPQMVSLRARANALRTQLEQEKERLVSSESDADTINRVNAEYQELLLSIEFATDAYKTALASLEQARIEAYRKLKHLVVLDPPVTADSAEYPRRIYNFFTTMVLILICYGLLVMTIATVREHRDA